MYARKIAQQTRAGSTQPMKIKFGDRCLHLLAVKIMFGVQCLHRKRIVGIPPYMNYYFV
jgi:hypothetical protein